MPSLSAFDQSVQDFINWFDKNKDSSKMKILHKLHESESGFSIDKESFGFALVMVVLMGGIAWLMGLGLLNKLWFAATYFIPMGGAFWLYKRSEKKCAKYIQEFVPCFQNCLYFEESEADEKTILYTLHRARTLNVSPEVINQLINQSHTDGFFWNTLHRVFAGEEEKKRTIKNNANALTLQEKKELFLSLNTQVVVEKEDATVSCKNEKSRWMI